MLAVAPLLLLALVLLGMYFRIPSPSAAEEEVSYSYPTHLFVGDSHFEYWLCDAPATAKAEASRRQCIESTRAYVQALGSSRVLCAAEDSDSYCSSPFARAFPRALNIGRAGAGIEDWIKHVKSDEQNSLTAAQSQAYYEFIVLELGANNLHSHSSESIVAGLQILARLLANQFPSSRVLVLSILPQLRDANMMFDSDSIDRTNKGLATAIHANAHPQIRFADVTSAFYIDSRLAPDAFVRDGFHLSRPGYDMFERAVKTALLDLWPSPPPPLPARKNNDFSKVLFLGDSLLELWLCYRPGERRASIGKCFDVVEGIRADLYNLADLHIDCAGRSRSSAYCLSEFARSFPNALMLARSGWSADTWLRLMQSDDALLELLKRQCYHEYAVVEIGTNSINQAPSDILALIEALLQELQEHLPVAKTMLLSVLPRSHAQFNAKIVELNALLAREISGHSFVRFCDVTHAFMRDDAVLHSAFIEDGLHLSASGYALFERAIMECMAMTWSDDFII